MFDKRNEELRRLEEELLEEETWLEDEEPLPCGASNTDRVDVDLDSYSDAILDPLPERKGRSLTGLKVIIALELLGIAAIGVYWLVQIL